MAKLTIYPSKDSFEVDPSENLLQALRERGVYVKSSCGGVASCSDCIIKIRSGEDHLNSPSFEELSLIGNVFHITKERLACQTQIDGDVTIDLSSHNKSDDQEKIKEKTVAKRHPNLRVRKKNDVLEMKRKRQEDRLEKKQDDNDWHKHWEKESDDRRRKKGGGARPKPFKINKDDQ